MSVATLPSGATGHLDPTALILSEAAVVVRDGLLDAEDCGMKVDHCPFCACLVAARRLHMTKAAARRAWTCFPQPLPVEVEPGEKLAFTRRHSLRAIGAAIRGRT
jgi:hypothetical protein